MRKIFGIVIFGSVLACGSGENGAQNDPEMPPETKFASIQMNGTKPMVAEDNFAGESVGVGECLNEIGCAAYRIGKSDVGGLIGEAGFEMADLPEMGALTQESVFYSGYYFGTADMNQAGELEHDTVKGVFYLNFDPNTGKISGEDKGKISIDANVDGMDLDGVFKTQYVSAPGVVSGHVNDKFLIGGVKAEDSNSVAIGFVFGANMTEQ